MTTYRNPCWVRRIGLTATVLALSALVISAGLQAVPSYATENAKERRDARDTRQEGRDAAREAKQECKKADDKSNRECRQDKREAKQETREQARGIRR